MLKFFLYFIVDLPPQKRTKPERFLTNPVFKFFTYRKENGKERAKCQALNCQFDSNNGRKTQNLVAHLKNKHEDDVFQLYLKEKNNNGQENESEDKNKGYIKLRLTKLEFLRSTIGIVTEDFKSFNFFESHNIRLIWDSICKGFNEKDGMFLLVF